IEVLRGVLIANPSHVDAHRQLSQIYRAESDPIQAVQVLLDLAALYRKQNLEMEAVAAEREALELDPSNVEISRRVINSLKAANRPGQAADQLERLAQIE